ncbi:N-acetylmuramoyl-L-alanine amidase [Priestia megaterium]|jgi:N-acetylmuramoyl-L-alanine amidase|uniref:N-acetylmuramoyl-L-alanine amidase n=1 Tax=Priestia megaterium TaxID=1404 RepID=UPI002A6B0CB5|nr:N-acetylmuramoyl-L-alanine amidase [Priestia megaterium]MDY0940014.1 N-acetylmuramoyl-L-alanine amidase [Priestia megaterium]
MKRLVWSYGIGIVAIVAVLSLFFMMKGQTEKAVVVSGNVPKAHAQGERVKQPISRFRAVQPNEADNEVKNVKNNMPEKADPPPFLVYIDPGHQAQANLEKEPIGPGAAETKIKVSGGTSGVVTKKPEYKLTLEASMILKKLLEEKGITVKLTRSSHSVNISNRERAELANNSKADLHVRIHADGSENASVKGLSVLTPAEDNSYTKPVYQSSLQASQAILTEVEKDQFVEVDGIRYRSDLSGFNWSTVPVTLVELGYMTNPEEDRNLSDQAYLTKLMNHVADGIAVYEEMTK